MWLGGGGGGASGGSTWVESKWLARQSIPELVMPAAVRGDRAPPPDCFVLEAFGEARVIELGGLGQGGRFVPTGEDLGDSFTGRERHRDTDWRGPGGARALGEAIAAVEVQH